MNTIELDSVLQHPDQVPWKEVDGVVMVLDLASGDFFELDEVGGRIWLGLDGQRSLRALAAEIAREYDARPEEIASDVIAFTTDLHGRGLVTLR